MNKRDWKNGTDTRDSFIYCSNLKCNKTDCQRHNWKTPWNTPVRRERFEPDKDGVCKEYTD